VCGFPISGIRVKLYFFCVQIMEASTSLMVSLNGSNWLIWKAKMKDLLYCKDLYSSVERDEAKPKSMSNDEWKKLE